MGFDIIPSSKLCYISIVTLKDWEDSSANKGISGEVWQPEFNPWNPHSERKELILKFVLWHPHTSWQAHTSAHLAHTLINKCNF